MTNEHWMQLYLQAWWALTHKDDCTYSVFYRWDDMWYGSEVYTWWVPRPSPKPGIRIATMHGDTMTFHHADVCVEDCHNLIL